MQQLEQRGFCTVLDSVSQALIPLPY